MRVREVAKVKYVGINIAGRLNQVPLDTYNNIVTLLNSVMLHALNYLLV